MLSRILVTGASGYIGGSVLSTLQSSNAKAIQESSIFALVRGKSKVEVLENNSYKTVLLEDFDNSEQLRKVASQYDAGYYIGPAKALVEGLARRSLQTGQPTHIIHVKHPQMPKLGFTHTTDEPHMQTSGTSNLGVSANVEAPTFSDACGDIYAHALKANKDQEYPQRTNDLSVIKTAQDTGVRSYTIMSPLIYGFGSGLFNQLTVQIPTMMRAAIKTGQAEVIEKGKGVWGHVHIDDLVELYELVVVKALHGDELPHGKNGYYFSTTGLHTWRDVAEGIAHALQLAAIGDGTVKSISMEAGARRWAGGDRVLAEQGFASMSKTVAGRGRHLLAWEPRRGEEDFRKHFELELRKILKEDE